MLNLRDHYLPPDPPNAVELRAFTHGLMPRTVPGMMQHFTDDWQQYGVDAWNHIPNHWRPDQDDAVGWWTLPAYLGDEFIAPLLGAPAGTCIMQPNVHWTVQCLLSAPEVVTERTEVLLTKNEFPSVLHSVQQWASLTPMRPHILPPTPAGFVDRTAVLDAIGSDTALVILSHVGFTTGELLPSSFLRAVADRVHAVGGLMVVDGYHSTGSYPVQVDAIEADVYFGGLLKEASGSSGNAYVYMRPGLRLTPRLTGWFGDADPFGFQPEPKAHPDVRQRFLGGTTAVASLYHAVEGVRLLLDVGLEAVRADSLAKTAFCIDRLEAAGLQLRSPRADDRRGAMVILEAPAADKLCAYLKQHHIYTDSRQGRFLRLAPFVWNTEAELARACAVISETVKSGRYVELPADALAAPGPVT